MNIVKTYSGQVNKCMCGCSGKWSYTDQEPRAAKIIFNKIMRRPEREPIMDNGVNIGISVTLGKRLLAAYY